MLAALVATIGIDNAATLGKGKKVTQFSKDKEGADLRTHDGGLKIGGK